MGLGLSNEEINILLDNDIARCKEELTNDYTWFENLNPARQDAMINLCFNLGSPRLGRFYKSLALMESGDFILAAAEFLNSRWAEQVGSRSIEVTDMIRTGSYQR